MAECPVCLEAFVASSSHSNGPVTGQCGHSICRGFIEKCHAAACEMLLPPIWYLACPYCKAVDVFRADWLVPNWAAIEMIRSSTEARGKDKQIKAIETKKKELVNLLERAERTRKTLKAEIERKGAAEFGVNVKLRAMEYKVKKAPECVYGERKSSATTTVHKKPEIIDLCSDDEDTETPKIVEMGYEVAASGVTKPHQRRHSECNRKSDVAIAPSTDNIQKSRLQYQVTPIAHLTRGHVWNIFKAIYHNKPAPANLPFSIVRVGPTANKLSPPSYEFECTYQLYCAQVHPVYKRFIHTDYSLHFSHCG